MNGSEILNPIRTVSKFYCAKAFSDTIRNAAAEAEQLHELHNDQLNIIYRQGWFKMFVPKEYGGLGLSIPEVLRIEECLSWADGSTAWVVTLCSGAAWVAGFLPPSILNEVFLNYKKRPFIRRKFVFPKI